MASLRNTAVNPERRRGAHNIVEACRSIAFSSDCGVDLLTNHRNKPSNRLVTNELINNVGGLGPRPQREKDRFNR